MAFLTSRRMPLRGFQGCLSVPTTRALHTSPARGATPIPHRALPGAPPPAPEVSVSAPQARIAQKKKQADLLREGFQPHDKVLDGASPLRKRFWKSVSVKDTSDGLQVMLDSRAVRTASKQILVLPRAKRTLAASIALEWDQLVSAQQALKQHYVPLTSLASRACDIQAADDSGDKGPREAIVKMMMRYLATDTLLCWEPKRNLHSPKEPGLNGLRQRQKDVAAPILLYLKTHVFPGVDIEPILDDNSIMPVPQPETTQKVIQGWASGLGAFELAALERGVLATKSLLIAARFIVEWSREFRRLQDHGQQLVSSSTTFGIEKAAEAATLEVSHQTEQWGEVEDSHDVDKEDLRRQLGSVILLVG